MQPTPTDAPLVVGFDLDMTLIDTAPGFGAMLTALGDELGVEFAVEEMTARLGPPLDLMLRRALPADADRRRGRPLPRALPRPRHRPGAAAALAPPRPSPPYAATAAGSWWSPASSPPTPGCTSTTSASTSTTSRARSGASARPTCCAARAVSVYVGDHVHDVEGALAAGATSVSVLTGGCTREELLAAGHPRRARRPDGVPRLARRAPARPPASPRSRPTCGPAARCWWRSAVEPTARFLLAAAVRALGARARRRGHRLLPLAAAGRARPRPRVRGVARRRRAHPRDPRDGARGLPRQRRRPLLLLQGRAARRAHPAGGRARPRPRRHRHQRRRRRGRLPARDPRRRRARRDHPAPRRRPDQGAGARGLAALGPADLGQAGRRLPLLTGRVRRRGHAAPAGPGGAGRGRPCASCSRAPAYPCETCGSATSATGPRSRSTPACSTDAPRSTAASSPTELRRRRPRGRLRPRPGLDPRGFRSGSMNELL